MTIHCSICGHEISSPSPPEQAQKVVLEKMAAHLKTHPAEAATLADMLRVAVQLLATYLLLRQYVDIPEDEAELLASFEQNEQHLAALFGFEPESETVS